MKATLRLLLLLLILSACSAPATLPAQVPALPSATSRPADILSPSATPAIEVTALPTQAAAPTLRLPHNPDGWQSLLVIPTVNAASIPSQCFLFYGLIARSAKRTKPRSIANSGCINPRWPCS